MILWDYLTSVQTIQMYGFMVWIFVLQILVPPISGLVRNATEMKNAQRELERSRKTK